METVINLLRDFQPLLASGIAIFAAVLTYRSAIKRIDADKILQEDRLKHEQEKIEKDKQALANALEKEGEERIITTLQKLISLTYSIDNFTKKSETNRRNLFASNTINVYFHELRIETPGVQDFLTRARSSCGAIPESWFNDLAKILFALEIINNCILTADVSLKDLLKSENADNLGKNLEYLVAAFSICTKMAFKKLSDNQKKKILEELPNHHREKIVEAMRR